MLVVLAGDGLVELLAEGLLDREVLADLLLEDLELLDQGRSGESSASWSANQSSLVAGELRRSPRGRRRWPLRAGGAPGPAPPRPGCGGTGPGRGTARARRCTPRRRRAGDEVHQGQRVVGVAQRLVVALQGEPGDPAMIELDELAVGLGAMLLRHPPGRGLAAGGQAAAGGAVAEVVEIGGEPVRPGAVGTPLTSSWSTPSSTRIWRTVRPSRARTSRAMTSPGSGSYGQPCIASSMSRRICRSPTRTLRESGAPSAP